MLMIIKFVDLFQVRSAVFSLVVSSCMKIPAVIQAVSCQVCPVVLSSLDEPEPAVCHNLWGAVLFVIRTVPVSQLFESPLQGF